MSRALGLAALAGLASGFLVLGVGGRILMRALTLTLEEGPRFTWAGSLAVLGAGAGWGAVTGLLLIPIRGRMSRTGPAAGAVLGLASCGLAGVALVAVAGLEVDAPPLFLLLSALSFPALFVVFGMAVDRLVSRAPERNGGATSRVR